jgi:hypothetical protein
MKGKVLNKWVVDYMSAVEVLAVTSTRHVTVERCFISPVNPNDRPEGHLVDDLTLCRTCLGIYERNFLLATPGKRTLKFYFVVTALYFHLGRSCGDLRRQQRRDGTCGKTPEELGRPPLVQNAYVIGTVCLPQSHTRHIAAHSPNTRIPVLTIKMV